MPYIRGLVVYWSTTKHSKAQVLCMLFGITQFVQGWRLPQFPSNNFFINSLAPGRSERDSKNGIYNLVLLIGIFKSSYDNVLKWIPKDLADNKSTLVQVMVWCFQATSHDLNQCWPRSPMPYGVTQPQWVKEIFYFAKIPVTFFCISYHVWETVILGVYCIMTRTIIGK